MAPTNPYNHPFPHWQTRTKLTPRFIAPPTPKPERFRQTTNPFGHPFPHHKVTSFQLTPFKVTKQDWSPFDAENRRAIEHFTQHGRWP